MIKDNINAIRRSLPQGVRLVAVSKTKPIDDIIQAYNAGQRIFGENYPTELRDKHAALPDDIEWHFIGHVQSKQLKYFIDFVSMIQGVDSLQHLADINLAANKAGRVVDCLLQFHIAQEETKFGFGLDESLPITPSDYPNVRICGVMGMATNTPDQTQVRNEFHNLCLKFKELKGGIFSNNPHFCQISMGMSHDYPIAIDEGATLVRIGSGIFGPRNYTHNPSSDNH